MTTYPVSTVSKAPGQSLLKFASVCATSVHVHYAKSYHDFLQICLNVSHKSPVCLSHIYTEGNKDQKDNECELYLIPALGIKRNIHVTQGLYLGIKHMLYTVCAKCRNRNSLYVSNLH